MTNPIAPPSESGWYAIKTKTKCNFYFVVARKKNEIATVVDGDETLLWVNGLLVWPYYPAETIIAFAGPIDPAAYLDGATKEGEI